MNEIPVEVYAPYSRGGAELMEELTEFFKVRGLRVMVDKESEIQGGMRYLMFGGVYKSKSEERVRTPCEDAELLDDIFDD